MDSIKFVKGSVPVKVVAKIFGRSESWVRIGIIQGWLPIGKAIRNGKIVTDITQIDSSKSRIGYYISPKLLYEQTGYMWEGTKNEHKN